MILVICTEFIARCAVSYFSRYSGRKYTVREGALMFLLTLSSYLMRGTPRTIFEADAIPAL